MLKDRLSSPHTSFMFVNYPHFMVVHFWGKGAVLKYKPLGKVMVHVSV